MCFKKKKKMHHDISRVVAKFIYTEKKKNNRQINFKKYRNKNKFKKPIRRCFLAVIACIIF